VTGEDPDLREEITAYAGIWAEALIWIGVASRLIIQLWGLFQTGGLQGGALLAGFAAVNGGVAVVRWECAECQPETLRERIKRALGYG